MKKILSFLFIMAVQQVFSQLVSGEIVTSGRKLLTETNFTIKGSKEGVVVYDLAIDLQGNVISETLVTTMTTTTSTPLKMDVRNYLKTFKFEAGNGYPKFHHVTVKITVVTK